ncbi:unnamed protein product [Effrenium voratum]|nr:unnamed protein product [Effrenium voratum]
MIGLGLLLQLAASQQIITEAPACDGVFLATFNIQNYGESKASKSAVLDALAAVIVRYDVVTIQEISQMPDGTGECGENTESSICSLQVAVNAHSPRHFSLRISPRIGDEQYAILYDTTLGTYLSGDEFPDSTATFSRPPYAFHLDIGGARLAIASTHTSPSTASAERLPSTRPFYLGWRGLLRLTTTWLPVTSTLMEAISTRTASGRQS